MCADADIDALLAVMRRQAKAECDEVLSHAQAEAREALARADAEVEAMTAKAMAEVKRQLAIELERSLGQARIDRLNELLVVKRKLIRQAFEQAGQTIGAMRDPAECRRVLGALIVEAVAAAGKDAEVSVARDQAELCRQAAAERAIACILRPIDGPPGTVIAATPDHGLQVDNSLATRLARAEALMICDVSAVLFASRPAGVKPV